MRLGTRSPNEFIQQLNQRNETIQKIFLENMTDKTRMSSLKVMMGDSAVTEQKTFDPKLVADYFQSINNNLEGWALQNVSISNNDDIRRIFTKFEIMVGNYMISGHVSIQFHVLLYYKPDQRVITCQKELSKIVDLIKNKEQQISDNSDQLVLDKLKEMGYKDFDHQKLFKVFYENDELSEKIYAEIQEGMDVDFQKLSEKKTWLFSELDSLLMETYQTTPTLIDDARLITGEEGFLFAIDLEFVKNKNREGLFDPRKMSDSVKKDMLDRLDSLEKIINVDKIVTV